MGDPKFEKTNHHYVPQHWLKRFRGDDGHLYKRLGSSIRQTSTAHIMSEDWLYTVFDDRWLPSDRLEDAFSKMESADAKLINTILTGTGPVSPSDRIELCDILGMQTCRHPNALRRGQDLEHELADILASVHIYGRDEFVAALASMGMAAEDAEQIHAFLDAIPEEQLFAEHEWIRGLSPQSSHLPG